MEFDARQCTEDDGRIIRGEHGRQCEAVPERFGPVLSGDDSIRFGRAHAFGEASIGQADHGSLPRPMRDHAVPSGAEQSLESRQLRVSAFLEHVHSTVAEEP